MCAFFNISCSVLPILILKEKYTNNLNKKKYDAFVFLLIFSPSKGSPEFDQHLIIIDLGLRSSVVFDNPKWRVSEEILYIVRYQHIGQSNFRLFKQIFTSFKY